MEFRICSHECLFHMEMFRLGIQYKYPFIVREAKKSPRCRVFTAIFVISAGRNQSTTDVTIFFGTVKNSTQENKSFLLIWLVWHWLRESKLFWFYLRYGRPREKTTMQNTTNDSLRNYLFFRDEPWNLSEWACGRCDNKRELPSDNLFAMLSKSSVMVKCIVARVGWLPEYLILCQFRSLSFYQRGYDALNDV